MSKIVYGSCLDIKRSALAYWEFDETSGNPTDATGNGFTLSAVSAPTSGAGVVGNCRVLNGTNQNFTIASGAAVGMNVTGGFTIRLRVNPSGVVPAKTLFSKWNATGLQKGYTLEISSAPLFIFFVSSDGSATTSLSFTGLTPVSGVWYDVFAGWDKNAGRLWMSVDAGPIQSSAYSAGIFANTAPFEIGVLGNGSSQRFPGSVDTGGIWPRSLKFAEIRRLHQARAYPFR